MAVMAPTTMVIAPMGIADTGVMAARAVGLDCGPMSGFDNATVDREFLVAQGWKSNFLVALGHADDAPVGERAPRLTFDEACRLL